jgi:hypothetical protein
MKTDFATLLLDETPDAMVIRVRTLPEGVREVARKRPNQKS